VITGLDHVQLACPPGAEDDARAFYGGLLGLREIEKPEPLRARGGVWFECGAHQLHLGVEEDFRPARKAHPAVRVGSFDELRALAERLGDVRWDDDLAGFQRFYVDDPFGNRLEVLTPTSTGAQPLPLR
jgi:catechol 2,3-dioxygenase-like lactoylglutathione lyase family enzyme